MRRRADGKWNTDCSDDRRFQLVFEILDGDICNVVIAIALGINAGVGSTFYFNMIVAIFVEITFGIFNLIMAITVESMPNFCVHETAG